MKATYIIPECNLPSLQDRIKKLNKRADKLGGVIISVTSEVNHRRTLYRNWDKSNWHKEGDTIPDNWKTTGQVMNWLTVTVNGETPRLNGWEFVAKLTPVSADNGVENLINEAPGQTCPPEFRSMVGRCDHCKTTRRRNETFVVSDGKKFKTVGRQCLKDFLGYNGDPHNLATIAEILMEVGTLCSNSADPEYFGGGNYEESMDLETLLEWTVSTINAYGWVSMGNAIKDNRLKATSSRVRFILGKPPHNREDREYWKTEVEKLKPTDSHKEEAAKVVLWSKTIDAGTSANSTYLGNVNLIARCGYVNRQTFGIAVSMIAAYRRAHNETTKQKYNIHSTHVGTPGKREEFVVTCERVFPSAGAFGETGIHTLVDERGNNLVWFASAAGWLEEGQKYKIAAMVKSHSEYQGKPQTIVNRVKVVEKL